MFFVRFLDEEAHGCECVMRRPRARNLALFEQQWGAFWTQQSTTTSPESRGFIAIHESRYYMDW